MDLKILSTQQIRDWDQYTIKNEPISSIDLMERAAQTFVDWLVSKYRNTEDQTFQIICGTGNNGGDGLAIARLLYRKFYTVKVYLFPFSKKTSKDFDLNLGRLPSRNAIPTERLDTDNLPSFNPNDIIIDAIIGSGLSREVDGKIKQVIEYINQQENNKISVDIPSGLFADKHTNGKAIQSNFTFCFELPKLAFFFPENYQYVGKWTFNTIGLLEGFYQGQSTNFYFLQADFIYSKIKKRGNFDHKGTYGHALLIMGSRGKMGAAVLAAKACLRSGAGLVTVHLPKAGELILQISIPEVMVSIDEQEHYNTNFPELSNYKTIGIGCGLGTQKPTVKMLGELLDNYEQPLVIDADALNIIAKKNDYLQKLPKDSILTPHPKEFERLFGKTKNDFHRNELQRAQAQKLGVYIILKGAYTCIACPNGKCYFNSTGNNGMATAGSGDVLTGIITGLLTQGYNSEDAALLGVYLHGLAGDNAANSIGKSAMIASDIINHFRIRRAF